MRTAKKSMLTSIVSLVLCIAMLAGTTFAWFTYVKILNPVVDVNISAWQVDFKDNENVLGTAMQFEVGKFYPGMNDYIKEIENWGIIK